MTVSTVSSELPPRSPSRRRWWLWGLAVQIPIGGIIGLVVWNQLASNRFAREMAQPPPVDAGAPVAAKADRADGRQTAQPQPVDADASYRRLVVGVWQYEHEDKRTMTLNADGTGTMIVELSGWQAVLSAPRLKFNMKWSVQNGRLKKQTVSGEPATQVNWILKTFGDHVDEPILELTGDRLLLLDRDGKTKYDWKCVKGK